MTRPTRKALIEVLSCEIDRRPAGAPGFADVAPFLRAVVRDHDHSQLVLEFAPECVDLVAAMVAAEQVCCSNIGWDLEREPSLRLRITASALALDALAASFQTPS